MPAHKHAHLMALYAQDAAATETPWERWEWKAPTDNYWKPSYPYEGPKWNPNYEYRRKPRVIMINGHEVPEPVREPLEIGTRYFVTSVEERSSCPSWIWDGGESDREWLAEGLIHLTREAAEAHARALLSFTETKETA